MINKIRSKVKVHPTPIKIKFEGYKDSGFKQKAGKQWEGDYGPPELAFYFKNKFRNEAGIGQATAESTFEQATPSSMTFELEINNTEKPAEKKALDLSKYMTLGIEPKKTSDVLDQINELSEVVFDINGKIHAPNFVKVTYGEFIFKGRCNSFDYKLMRFDRNGVPFAAKVTVKLDAEISEKERKSKSQLSSPDMTHHYVVSEGESLPNISDKIYGRSDLYMELARINNLNSIRHIEPGTKLILPPLQQ